MNSPLLFSEDELTDPIESRWASTPESGAPRHPVYIPSLGRASTATSWRFLKDYRFVVERTDYPAYVEKFGKQHVLSLPGEGYGTVTFVRNWIKAHATSEGHRKHWQIDDNVAKISRHHRQEGKSVYEDVDGGAALRRVERFVDSYANVGIVGLKHVAFAWTSERAVCVNRQAYSCVLVDNDELRWRPGMIEDTDYSLQVLNSQRCTMLITDYVLHKAKSGVMAGGNTSNIYQGDGRIRNIEGLRRAWPHLDIKQGERFGKPVAMLGSVWRRFKQRPELAA